MTCLIRRRAGARNAASCWRASAWLRCWNGSVEAPGKAARGVYGSLSGGAHNAGMARIIALAPAMAPSAVLVETMRRMIVLGCALALILAEAAIPHV